jgi:hypothetical protein
MGGGDSSGEEPLAGGIAKEVVENLSQYFVEHPEEDGRNRHEFQYRASNSASFRNFNGFAIIILSNRYQTSRCYRPGSID